MAATDAGTPAVELPDPQSDGAERPRQKAMTIGAVCKALIQEFPEISCVSCADWWIPPICR